jgi:2-polyprenyl-6-methoxyphenol hydroxylase-like FAD-dependent oxidoreductase
MKHQTVTIIGGGIAGLATAIALKKIGLEAQVFEASTQIKPVGAGLGLGSNAMKAFDALGIYNEILEKGRTLSSFSIYDHEGTSISKTDFDPLSNIGNFTIHRASLHELLLSKLDSSTIHLGKRVKQFETIDFGIKLLFEDGTSHTTNYLIVADGIHSVVRQQLIPHSKMRYAGYTCWRSVIKDETLSITETSETWGSNGRFGIVPLSNGQVYWFACVNAEVNNKRYKSFQVEDLIQHFEKYHNPIPTILKLSENKDLIQHDIYDIEPLKQFAYGRMVLIGDAAHATTPNMGQGACQAIEDAVVLAKCMAQNDNFEEAFQSFEKRRLDRTKWVIETSNSIGKIAQLENEVLIGFRNIILRSLPKFIGNGQLRKIEKVDF